MVGGAWWACLMGGGRRRQVRACKRLLCVSVSLFFVGWCVLCVCCLCEGCFWLCGWGEKGNEKGNGVTAVPRIPAWSPTAVLTQLDPA